MNLKNYAMIGEDVTIYPSAKIISPEVIWIGNSVIIDDFVFLMGGSRTILGDFIHIACFTSITGGGEFVMDDFSGISGGVRIYTGNEDYSGHSLTNPTVPAPYRKPIRSFVHIKKHAIIGANSVILPGVTIGEGVAVGANSLVTDNCKPWTIYVGTPAKPIKNRQNEEIIRLELELSKKLYNSHGEYIPKRMR
jgi:acetyltransferase-like isoleucine patch superfamily enzyme